MRNPEVAVKRRHVTLGGLKNWLILGGVGFAGYLIYSRFKSQGSLKNALDSVAAGKKIAAPDLNGPLVRKFDIASTRTPNCIQNPEKGFVYNPITSTNPVTGYNTFNAVVTGNFTRRLLCRGSKRWAEIKPLAGGQA